MAESPPTGMPTPGGRSRPGASRDHMYRVWLEEDSGQGVPGLHRSASPNVVVIVIAGVYLIRQFLVIA